MLQIPFSEWLREYWQCIQLKTENRKKLNKMARVSFDANSDNQSVNTGEMEDNSKYRKVYHVREDFKIEWRVIRYNARDNCWCLWFLQKKGDRAALRNDGIRSSRPSIVLPQGIPNKFRVTRESFIANHEV